MTETEFQIEEFEFLENLKNSSLYQRMKELSRMINADEGLNHLAEERDSYMALADKEKDDEKKHELLVLFNQKDNELRSSPLMKEYLSIYQSLRAILTNLADALTKEIKLL
jgi:cell fate (sporulation/competence/biofilm development) regulator YlbF (YheA/YmcA/DUF963 family)